MKPVLVAVPEAITPQPLLWDTGGGHAKAGITSFFSKKPGMHLTGDRPNVNFQRRPGVELQGLDG
ncbi:hypothetical protein AcW1_007937 [Taiwanofungus camphoratus]|nr:hypothetical protein AcW1_007937 [Antrodia cinnamomea]KAI0955603.1 hypothetical protein AcV7_006225 [Antrodia cinnamomea]